MLDIVMWFALAAVGLLIAGLGSAFEIGAYSLNPVRLHVLEHSGNARARILSQHLAAPATLIASMLIVHNTGVKLATHAGAVLLRSQDLSEWQVIGFDAVIMMPLLFIFAETVPKNLFAVYADRLMYLFAYLMAILVGACRYSGICWLLTSASNLIMKPLGIHIVAHSFHPRHRVRTLVKESVGYGLLDDEQLAITERTLALAGQTVEEHMQPWRQVIRLKSGDHPKMLWKLANEMSHSRFPVVNADGSVIGVLNIANALVYMPQDCPAVAELIDPVKTLNATTPLRRALATLRKSTVPMAIVTRQGQPVGIVTLKDLIEPITGELAAW